MGDPVLPPGQALTAKFPVVGEKAPPPGALDLASWSLVVDGLVERPLRLNWPSLRAGADHQRTVDIHCVTGWTRLDTTFTGLPLAVLLDQAIARPEARFVRFEAYSARGHDTSLPLALAREDTWLVHSRDGAPLEPEHGWPLRTLTPSRYFYKSLKWVHRIELLGEDRLGYWERESSYHNVGDPWAGDQRFVSGSLDPRQVARFRDASSLRPWRGPRKVLLGLDLRRWSPIDRDLSGLQLKNCDLRRAELAGCRLREANLSLSDLRQTNLRGVDARDADLEGADFRGADLRQADFRDTALSAARFVGPNGNEGARVDGLDCRWAEGLLESQRAYLEASGARL